MKSLKWIVVTGVFLLSCAAGELKLYHGSSQAEAWANSHSNDPKAKLIKEKIVSQPQGIWFAGHIPSGYADDVARAKEP